VSQTNLEVSFETWHLISTYDAAV